MDSVVLRLTPPKGFSVGEFSAFIKNFKHCQAFEVQSQSDISLLLRFHQACSPATEAARKILYECLTSECAADFLECILTCADVRRVETASSTEKRKLVARTCLMIWVDILLGDASRPVLSPRDTSSPDASSCASESSDDSDDSSSLVDSDDANEPTGSEKPKEKESETLKKKPSGSGPKSKATKKFSAVAFVQHQLVGNASLASLAAAALLSWLRYLNYTAFGDIVSDLRFVAARILEAFARSQPFLACTPSHLEHAAMAMHNCMAIVTWNGDDSMVRAMKCLPSLNSVELARMRDACQEVYPTLFQAVVYSSLLVDGATKHAPPAACAVRMAVEFVSNISCARTARCAVTNLCIVLGHMCTDLNEWTCPENACIMQAVAMLGANKHTSLPEMRALLLLMYTLLRKRALLDEASSDWIAVAFPKDMPTMYQGKSAYDLWKKAYSFDGVPQTKLLEVIRRMLQRALELCNVQSTGRAESLDILSKAAADTGADKAAMKAAIKAAIKNARRLPGSGPVRAGGPAKEGEATSSHDEEDRVHVRRMACTVLRSLVLVLEPNASVHNSLQDMYAEAACATATDTAKMSARTSSALRSPKEPAEKKISTEVESNISSATTPAAAIPAIAKVGIMVAGAPSDDADEQDKEVIPQARKVSRAVSRARTRLAVRGKELDATLAEIEEAGRVLSSVQGDVAVHRERLAALQLERDGVLAEVSSMRALLNVDVQHLRNARRERSEQRARLDAAAVEAREAQERQRTLAEQAQQSRDAVKQLEAEVAANNERIRQLETDADTQRCIMGRLTSCSVGTMRGLETLESQAAYVRTLLSQVSSTIGECKERMLAGRAGMA